MAGASLNVAGSSPHPTTREPQRSVHSQRIARGSNAAGFLAAICIICSCAKAPEPRLAVSTDEVLKADHAMPAFGGRLLGTDRGEWIGELAFEDRDGSVETVLNENVHGIVENPAGIFVFTGLDHLGGNVGTIYSIDMTADRDVVATRLGRLPGAPRDVKPQPGGATTFLVASGRFDAESRQVYECYELRGDRVRRSLDCLPPKTSH